jgi:hypothetical protein
MGPTEKTAQPGVRRHPPPLKGTPLRGCVRARCGSFVVSVYDSLEARLGPETWAIAWRKAQILGTQ